MKISQEQNEEGRDELTSGVVRIVLVGRTNVGKSTLFNRLIGKRYAIEGKEAHLTRDVRTYRDGQIEWADLPGLEARWLKPRADQPQWQTILQNAIREADLCVWVVDGQAGLDPEDMALFRFVATKPWVGVVNKVDHEKISQQWAAEARAPRGRWFEVSASHKLGTDQLKQALIELAQGTVDKWSDARRHRVGPSEAYPPVRRSEWPTRGNDADGCLSTVPFRVAIVGRPNAGKSSFCNQALGQERVRVSAIAHTTRDVVEVSWPILPGQDVRLVDTAGLRLRQAQLDTRQVSELQAKRAIERCEGAFFFVDASCGMGQTDVKIYHRLRTAYTTVIVVVNKWDLLFPERVWRSQREARKEIVDVLQADHGVIFHSTRSVFSTPMFQRLLAAVHAERHRKISTTHMNEWVQHFKSDSRFSQAHHLVSVKYAVQKDVAPQRIYCFGKVASNYSSRKKDLVRKSLLRSFQEYFDIRYGPVFFSLRPSKKVSAK